MHAELNEKGIKPIACELAFEKADYTFNVEDWEGKIYFHGIIDRVDKAADGSYIMTDYKTGQYKTGKDFKYKQHIVYPCALEIPALPENGRVEFVYEYILSENKNKYRNSIKYGKLKDLTDAELYYRISKDIASALEKDDLNDNERNNLKNALQDIDKMTISTIPGFCQKMLRERAFDAKLPIDAAVIEEEEEKRIKTAFFENWFTENIDNIALANVKCYKGSPGLWDFKETALETSTNRITQTTFFAVCINTAHPK